jgi:hypothetical protein
MVEALFGQTQELPHQHVSRLKRTPNIDYENVSLAPISLNLANELSYNGKDNVV